MKAVRRLFLSIIICSAMIGLITLRNGLILVNSFAVIRISHGEFQYAWDSPEFARYHRMFGFGIHVTTSEGNWQSQLPMINGGSVTISFVVIFSLALFLWLILENIRREQRRFQRQGHCFHCKYDLKGNESGKCPECGNAIAAQIDEPA